MGPLASTANIEAIMKQRRELLKTLNDEARKERLNKVKVATELAKAKQEGLPIEDTLPAVAVMTRVKQVAAPLAAPTNPEAGKRDTVHTLLEPGEAVIPRTVAQDPAYKPAIKEMVQEGRERNRAIEAPLGSGGAARAREAILSRQGRVNGAIDQSLGYEDGTVKVDNKSTDQPKQKSFLEKVAEVISAKKGKPEAAPLGSGAADRARQALGGRQRQVNQAIDQAQGYQEGSTNVAHDDTFWENLLEAQRQAESRGQHYDKDGNLVTSKKGAQGIAQIIPKTGVDPGYGVAPLKDNSEAEARRFQRDYMKAMYREFGGDIDKALAAYNYGPGNIKKLMNDPNRRDNWSKFLPSETSDYVTKIRNTVMDRARNTGSDIRQASAYDPTRPVASPAEVAAINAKYSDVDAAVAAPPVRQDDMDVFTGVRTSDIPPPGKNIVQGERELAQQYGNIPLPKEEIQPPPKIPLVDVAAAAEKAEKERIYKEAMELTLEDDTTKRQLSVLQSATPPADVDKKDWLAAGIAKIFGDKGLFNERELLKFSILAAGGLLTGGSVGGSIRFAGLAAMKSAEDRYQNQKAVEAQEANRIRTAQEKYAYDQHNFNQGLEKDLNTAIGQTKAEAQPEILKLYRDALNEVNPKKREALLRQGILLAQTNRRDPSEDKEPKTEIVVDPRDPDNMMTGFRKGGIFYAAREGGKHEALPANTVLLSPEQMRAKQTEFDTQIENKVKGRITMALQGRDKSKSLDSKEIEVVAKTIASDVRALQKDLGNPTDMATIVDRATANMIEELKMKNGREALFASVDPEAFRKYVYGNAIIETRKADGAGLYSIPGEKGAAARPSSQAVAEFKDTLDQGLGVLRARAKEEGKDPSKITYTTVMTKLEEQYKADPKLQERYKTIAQAESAKGYSPFLLWVTKEGGVK